MNTQSLQSCSYQGINHGPGNTGITTNYQREVFFIIVLLQPGSKSGGKFHHIQRCQVFVDTPADGSADT